MSSPMQTPGRANRYYAPSNAQITQPNNFNSQGRIPGQVYFDSKGFPLPEFPEEELVEQGAQAAEAIFDSLQTSWTIGQNSTITNNYFSNISGANGIYLAQGERANLTATAQQRGLDRTTNMYNSLKSVAGPFGSLLGYVTNSILGSGVMQAEVDNTNFNLIQDSNQNWIDPRNAQTSTYRANGAEEHATDTLHAENGTETLTSPDLVTDSPPTTSETSTQSESTTTNNMGDSPSYIS